MRTTFSYRKRLLRLAALSFPLITIFSFVPLILFISSLPDTHTLASFITPQRIITGVGAMSLTALAQWITNLWLFGSPDRNFRISLALRYFISFAIGFLFLRGLGMLMRPAPAILSDFGMLKLIPLAGVFANNLFILVMIRMISGQEERAQLKLEKAQLEIAHLMAQQEQLKQNIHPHFLFNALSTLMVLIEQSQAAALDYAGKLSGFLRSSLVLAKKDKNTVQEELDFFYAYLELQQVRFHDSIQVEVAVPEEISQKGFLPVFSLQILAENAIKHNALGPQNPLKIKISHLNSGHLEISNNLIPKFQAEASTGTGLQNLSERIRLLGGEPPEINEEGESFRVKLEIL